jgi:hypothetical protein
VSSPEVSISEEPLVHCFWCERPHRGEHPLAVCPECTARLTSMHLLEMSGSYPLTAEAIDDALKRKSPGNYALGYMDEEPEPGGRGRNSDPEVQSALHTIGRETGMWKSLRESLHRIWLDVHRGADERRAEKARARFWADVREGQQEAVVASRP